MEERLVRDRSKGLNTTGIRTWGMLFLVMAAVGKALLQNRMLQMVGSTDLLAALEAEGGMLIATLALAMQAVEGCAIPVFCFLLLEGVNHTSDFNKYLIRVAVLAVLTELPFNFAMSGKLLDFSSRNPVFGMALSLVLIWFYRNYPGKSVKDIAIKIAVTAAAIVWAGMLSIEHGIASVAVSATLWGMRGRPNFRNLMASAVLFGCCLVSPFYVLAPMGFLILHFYNGEKGNSRQEFHYLVYPLALLAIGLIGIFFM